MSAYKGFFPLNKLDPNIRCFSSEGMLRIVSLNFIRTTANKKRETYGLNKNLWSNKAVKTFKS